MTATTTPESLVGRTTEIETIEDAIEKLIMGQGSVVLCSGEPGIGKSTMARHAAAKAKANDVSSYWGFCWEAGGAPAYWPWTQLLRSLVDDWELTDSERSSLSLLVPEFQVGDQSAAELQPDQAKFMLLDSVRMMLARVSAQSNLILIFEDLHASDQDSLKLLHYLARHITSMPILVIGTFREIEARSTEVSESLSLIERDATVLRLSRLGRRDVARYMESRTGSAPQDDVLQEWFEITSGNPLFLHELVGLLDRPESSKDLTQSLPATIEQVIRQQIGYLPQGDAELLAHASVLGKAFTSDELVLILREPVDWVPASLDSAIEAGILFGSSQNEYEFSHVLYREVLYRDLPRQKRNALNLKYAQALKEKISRGDADGWSVLASHLAAAGPDHRDEAIEAWRHAAKRANAVLAFDAAASMLNTAINTFGEGPRFDPSDRCRLLIECAEAMLLAGDIEGGHARCCEAFEIARTLEDSAMMSIAALTYGGAIIVASVDQTLINMLRECLETSMARDDPCRARVKARLAAALQPAVNPAEPMDMAREAISEARACDNEDVLYNVMRYAIAALMDFGPTRERLALNQEVLSLAKARGDIPFQFRSNLRLLIDAAELADREEFDRAIESCVGIAGRIALPHYMWRAHSVRAMQATMEGRFADASRLLDKAELEAGRIDDLEARVTIPIQRFSILCDWESDDATPMSEIQSQLDAACSGAMAEAKFFLQPIIDIYTAKGPGDARSQISNQVFINRTFAGNDRFSIVALSELALLADDLDLTSRAFDALLGYRKDCATTGLLGSGWCGPVALQLGRIAKAFGRHEEARKFLEQALEIAGRMSSRPYVARVHQALAELATEVGDREGANLHSEMAQELLSVLEMRTERGMPSDDSQTSDEQCISGETRFSIRDVGDVYEVSLDGSGAVVKSSKGLAMLAILAERPDRDIHVLELSGDGTGAVIPEGDVGPALDQDARQAYQKRVSELQEELEDAMQMGDTPRAESVRDELEFISRELSRAFGLGGRERPQAKAAERARVNVRRRIKDAINRIDQQIPGAGRYLENTVKTGSYCRYTPM
ncbi:MAG TPA: AAA family ATPase [Xanthomonadales bacterium]|nr:AAA family ATPase [Xanthomonadales bacterium]